MKEKQREREEIERKRERKGEKEREREKKGEKKRERINGNSAPKSAERFLTYAHSPIEMASFAEKSTAAAKPLIYNRKMTIKRAAPTIHWSANGRGHNY